MFAYCGNNPVNMVDSDGKDPTPIWALNIVQGKGTPSDFAEALNVYNSGAMGAWVGHEKLVQNAVNIALSAANTAEGPVYESPKKEKKYDGGVSTTSTKKYYNSKYSASNYIDKELGGGVYDPIADFVIGNVVIGPALGSGFGALIGGCGALSSSANNMYKKGLKNQYMISTPRQYV